MRKFDDQVEEKIKFTEYLKQIVSHEENSGTHHLIHLKDLRKVYKNIET